MPENRDSASPAAAWKTATLAGLALIVGGFAWQALAPTEAWLSEDQAQAHVDAVVAMHGRTMTESPADAPGLVADRQRLAETRAAVEAAQSRRVWWPRMVQIAGAAIALIGWFGSRAAA